MRYTIALKENRDFRRLYSSKKSVVCPYFVMYSRKNNLETNRLGLTVGAKIGIAVNRNKIKRRLKEMYRINEGCLKNSFDIVIVARGRAKDAKFDVLCREFQYMAHKLDLLK